VGVFADRRGRLIGIRGDRHVLDIQPFCIIQVFTTVVPKRKWKSKLGVTSQQVHSYLSR
jgi:hypothetical protein